MAVADAPGLMDIASTLAQDEIPFKLRCAICNNLAVNAFRLPCCDQSTCETCQASLSDTCPVCTHTPVSPDLCKPNKALRTTLKAFLRTEEKKREKDRQSAAAPSDAAPVDANPVESAPQNGDTAPTDNVDTPVLPEPVQPPSEGAGVAAPAADASATNTAEESAVKTTITNVEKASQPEAAGDEINGTEATLEPTVEKPSESVVNGEPALDQDAPGDINPAPALNTGENFQMGWNGNAVNPYMAGMFNFPNTMGMSMGMDPADQGMFGNFGMNMTGMGMNSGDYNGGMYGSLGWEPSQNNNMWQGAQNKFNPNAFANGTGPYGGTFGSNMSAYPSNYQSGYYGGYGRGSFRGRGRGQYQGFGRGYGPPNHYHSNLGYPNNPAGTDQGIRPNGGPEGDNGVSGNPDSQVQTIPTIDGDQSVPFGSNGQHAPGPGVEGAPAAPRAMRQGLPNTSVYRQRVQVQGRASNPSDAETKANSQVQSESLRESPPHCDSRSRSPSVQGAEDERDTIRAAEPKRMDRVDQLQSGARRSRSPSRTSSRRSSRRRHTDDDRDGDRKDIHRSNRSRRRRSRSRSSSRHGDHRSSARLGVIPEHSSSSRTKMSSEGPESRDLASRISGSRRSDKDRVDWREDDRSRVSNRDSRRRDRDRTRDRERGRDRRDRDRDTDRDRRREDRDKDRAGERDRDRRDHPRDRDRDRKRSRRDRSQSVTNDHPQARRVKHEEDRTGDQSNGVPGKGPEPEKDPYTLEREARNKERLQREKQHREKANSGRRRESRQDRVVAGRRINYKYEDEL
ncbi:hypothetical protein N7541_008793 [Penicillium brevicompactum]|uniref:RING-type domain-containing protein n=1 Tax=Penicillium brevicompactum TaxID=5074 RepID=A0A9W9QVB0_PENBR|nr:hypothetical protein N7541_008793 [Penicillium brevicompactum]